jgi:hypothetical protein
VRDLADPPGGQKRDRDSPPSGREGGRLDEADEPTIRATDPRDDRTIDRAAAEAPLSGLEHSDRPLELWLVRVGHLDLDQEVRHGAMVDADVAPRHRGEHRVST